MEHWVRLRARPRSWRNGSFTIGCYHTRYKQGSHIAYSGFRRLFYGLRRYSVVDLGARSYRGIVDFIHNSSGTLTAVNVIDLEEYLYGVVAAEIPSSYEYEAIKAQACAARTYALYKWNRESDIGYDICDSTHCQAYMGYDYEDSTTRQAVIDTEGELIYYNGSPIEALFFSSSGGYTEDAVNVWGTDVAYLKAVDDSQEINCPEWERTVTLDDLDAIISANGYGIGSATGMRDNDRQQDKQSADGRNTRHQRHEGDYP